MATPTGRSPRRGGSHFSTDAGKRADLDTDQLGHGYTAAPADVAA